MPKRNDEILLTDIITNLRIVLDFTTGYSFNAFNTDIKTQYAADRCFEIIGEAARNISDEFVLENPGIEWHKLIAFRNVLIHEYFRVDLKIIWKIIEQELPTLKDQIDSILWSN